MRKTIIQACWYKGYRNVGDAVVEPLLNHFGYELRYTDKSNGNKFLGVGSIMSWLRDGDTVWGTGCIREQSFHHTGVNFLAVRGPLTRSLITGSEVPEVYGDPAVLLPLLYNPDVEIEREVGWLPHYADKPFLRGKVVNLIDIEDDWQSIVRQMKACRKIVTSSLHGVILAEAYGIPVEWVKYGDRVLGGQFKFQDYFLGTGRPRQDYGPIKPPTNMPEVQQRLITALDGLKRSSCVIVRGSDD